MESLLQKMQSLSASASPLNAIYKHRDQRLGTIAVTQCVHQSFVARKYSVLLLFTRTRPIALSITKVVVFY